MMRTQYWWGLAGLALLAAATFCAALLVGSAGLSSAGALRALFGGGDDFSRMIVQTVRLPRAVAGFAVGSLLALAGVLLQALFRNPLADPLVLGVSGGAAIGALLGMLTAAGFAAMHCYATAGGTLIGAAGAAAGPRRRRDAAAAVRRGAGQRLRRPDHGAADAGRQRPAARHGVLAGRGPELGAAPGAELLACAGIALIGRVYRRPLAQRARRRRTAQCHRRAFRPAAARLAVFIASAALTSIAVIGGGMIGFVGLIAPHLVRLGFNTSDHRVVAPAAALAGGTLLCLADLIGRTVAGPRELPVGAVMALIGAPVFIVLLRRQTR